MSRIDAPQGAIRRRQASVSCPVRSASDANLATRTRRAGRTGRIVRDLLARLNKLLGLSDFSRGDVFRD